MFSRPLWDCGKVSSKECNAAVKHTRSDSTLPGSTVDFAAADASGSREEKRLNLIINPWIRLLNYAGQINMNGFQCAGNSTKRSSGNATAGKQSHC